MIRSPISSEEHLRNRVSALEARMTKLEARLVEGFGKVLAVLDEQAAYTADVRVDIAAHDRMIDDLYDLTDR